MDDYGRLFFNSNSTYVRADLVPSHITFEIRKWPPDGPPGRTRARPA
jgi:hypothetical protein